jgi:branched-chain amino acid transport system substrate-binding protein
MEASTLPFKSALVPAALAVALLGVGPATGAPVNIDVILPMTGNQAFSGAVHAQTIGVYEKYVNASGGINGRPVHFDIHDDHSSPVITVQLTNQIVAAKAPVLLGSSFQAACLAETPLVANSTVEFCLSPGLNPKQPNVFAVAVSTNYIVPAIYKFMRDRGYKKIAVITSTDATGQSHDALSQVTMDRPDFKNMSIVAYEHFAPTELSVSAQIARIKSQNPQGIVVVATGSAFATVLRGMHDAGLDIPVITSAVNMNEDQLKQYEPFLPKEVVFNSTLFYARPQDRKGSVRAAVDEFYNGYKRAGVVPSPESTSWDPAKIVVSALRALGSNASGEAVANYISNLHDFAGASGVYDFRLGDHHGLTDADIVWVKYQPHAEPKFVAVSKPGGIPL